MSLFSLWNFKPQRKIGDFTAYIALEEVCFDELEITSHPVQDGSAITDHAYKKPASLRIDLGSSPLLEPLNDIYAKFLKMQSDRIPMTVVTGKRTYQNMLVKSITLTNNENTENIVFASMELQEIILADVQTVNVTVTQNRKLISKDRKKQKKPGKTGSTVTAPKKKSETVPKKDTSFIKTITNLISG